MSGDTKRFESPNAITELATRLARLPQVRKHARNGEDPAEELANTISGLEGSFYKVLDEILPKLSEESDPDALFGLLIDLGEELRHILYHIHDAPFYRYIIG